MLNTYLKEEVIKGVKVFKTYAKISDLKVDPNNPRDITDIKLKDLQEFLEKYGQIKPLLVDIRPEKEGNLIGGNQRLKAELKRGTTEAWIEPRAPTGDAQAFEMGTIDNMEFGAYVKDKLGALIDKYKEEINFSKLTVNFNSPVSFAELLEKKNGAKEDALPQPSAEPATSKLGDVYQLGRHRLMCGDATKLEDVEKLMNGQKADMVFTDPPYGYKYESNHQDTHKELLNDDKILDFFPLAVTHTKENSPIYTFCGFQSVDKWLNLVKQNGLGLKNMIIWKKNNWSMGDLEGAYAGQYEIILYTPKGRVLLVGGRDRDVWEFDREPPKDHPTMKPIALCAAAIANHKADIILDFFGGSGSTLIAAEQTNRTCYMMELDPKYVDVIRKRYAKFIGKEDEWESIAPKI